MTTTTFRERMVGPVVALRPAEARGATAVPARAELVGRDVVDLARATTATARREERTLDLDGLVLEVEPGQDPRDGSRAKVTAGHVIGLGPGVDGPVVAGFADLLPRTAPGERRMFYRLLVAGADGSGAAGRYLVEGVKVVAGSRLRAWSQTTTLYTRVSRVDDPRILTAVGDLDEPVPCVVPLWAGTLRIRPGDLARQVGSMRGGVPSFLATFARRLVVR